ncbi:hypothetical protein OsJ_35121 [Oryza sativa Japonica Group]|uniref:Uncharacterized protein n=1 Tax=Oryza sativa subsp. japonica TaxID=39947 RepID=B9GBQ5_ORYSJ|nr:hypothetical protein OsJ_35121 [Oryza sativa Japonica Group]
MVATSAAVYRRVLKAVQKHVGGGTPRSTSASSSPPSSAAPLARTPTPERGCGSPGITPTSSPASTTTRTCYSRII